MDRKNVWATILGLALSVAAAAQEAEPPPKATPEVIARLIKQLDADDFAAREQATDALIKLGEEVEASVKKAAAESKSAEARERAERVLASIERERLQRNALQLDTIYLLARAICEDKATPTDLDPMIDKILAEISAATKGKALKMPVRIENCTPRPGLTTEPRSLFVGDTATTTSLRDSVAVFDVGGQCASINNSIIVAWGVVEVSSCTNSIIIAGADVSVTSARNSVILSGGRIDVNSCQKSVLGSGETLRATFPRDGTIVVNTKFVPGALDTAALVDVPGLVLRDKPLMPRLLDDKLQVTYLSNKFMLFQLPGQSGEYVVRTGNDLLDPLGKPLAGLEGWNVLRLSLRFAMLKNEEERTFLRLPRPGDP
jgi:hypothetical protein